MCACVISARKAKHFDATTMFTYSDANTPLGQSERAYYLILFYNREYHYSSCCVNPIQTGGELAKKMSNFKTV